MNNHLPFNIDIFTHEFSRLCKVGLYKRLRQNVGMILITQETLKMKDWLNLVSTECLVYPLKKDSTPMGFLHFSSELSHFLINQSLGGTTKYGSGNIKGELSKTDLVIMNTIVTEFAGNIEEVLSKQGIKTMITVDQPYTHSGFISFPNPDRKFMQLEFELSFEQVYGKLSVVISF